MPAYYVASALHKLQRDIIGLVPLVKGKGRLAKDVSEIMLRLRREAIVEGEVDMIEPGEEAGESLVDAIVLLDREVDTITPFCTQLTSGEPNCASTGSYGGRAELTAPLGRTT